MLESLWSVRLTAGAPLAGTPSTPILTCLTKEMITKLNIPNQKGGRKGQRRTCSWCPCCQQTAHSRTTSLRILYIGGWNHSDLEFIISLCDLLIITPFPHLPAHAVSVRFRHLRPELAFLTSVVLFHMFPDKT